MVLVQASDPELLFNKILSLSDCAQEQISHIYLKKLKLFDALNAITIRPFKISSKNLMYLPSLCSASRQQLDQWGQRRLRLAIKFIIKT